MRTTLTLDPDVARLIDEEVHRRRTTFKQVVNDAIRVGLSRPHPTVEERRYTVEPHRATLLPGIDRVAFNRLADQLEDDHIVAGSGASRAADR